jgi:hypothetical protein
MAVTVIPRRTHRVPCTVRQTPLFFKISISRTKQASNSYKQSNTKFSLKQKKGPYESYE